jgi:hypothetical protein
MTIKGDLPMNRRSLIAAFALSAFVARTASASTTRGPNGGQRIDLAGGHAELVADGSELRLYLTDNAYRPRSAEGATGQAIVLVAGRQSTVVLSPAGPDMLRGRGDFSAAQGMRVVVTLTMPGQRPSQGRFTPLDQA